MTKKNIVYKATNIINNKCYIGQTTDTLDNRIKRHLIKSKKTNNYFHNAIRKHGIDNFKWEILYECDSKEILNLMETFKIIVEPRYHLYPEPNVYFGESKSSIINKFGWDFVETESTIGQSQPR